MDSSPKLEYSEQNRNRKGQRGKWTGVVCATEGCELPAKCRGFCPKHYARKKWADGHRPPSHNPASIRARHLKHRYGITPAEYERILAEQQGKCAICGSDGSASRNPERWRYLLAVDHCHATGKVRGLLCNGCNAGIGHLGTESAALAAARYLRLHAG